MLAAFFGDIMQLKFFIFFLLFFSNNIVFAAGDITPLKDNNDHTEAMEEKVREYISDFKNQYNAYVNNREAERMLHVKELERKIFQRYQGGDPLLSIRLCLSNGSFGNFPYAKWKSNAYGSQPQKEKEAYSIYCVGKVAKALYNNLKLRYDENKSAVKYINYDGAAKKSLSKESSRGNFNRDKSGNLNKFEMFIFGKNSSKNRVDGAQCSKVYDPVVLNEKTGDLETLTNTVSYLCSIPISFTSGFFNFLKSKGFIRNQKIYFPSEKIE